MSVEADFGNNLLPFNNESTKQSNKSSEAVRRVKKQLMPYVTAFDEKYNQLKDLRDRDILNEKQYLDALRALNEKYYKTTKIHRPIRKIQKNILTACSASMIPSYPLLPNR